MSFTVPARRLTTLLLAATVIALGVTPNASAAAVPAPVVHIATASQQGNTLTIAGTGWSKARPGALSMGILVDGRNAPSHHTPAGQRFTLTVPVPVGKHVVCVVGWVPGGHGVTAGCLAVTGKVLATTAQLRAEAALIDPHHTVTWALGVTPARSAGQSFMWENRVLISSSLAAADLRTVVRHEWGHILTWRFFGSTPQGWATAQNTMNRLSGLTDGEEHAADCISFTLGAMRVSGLGFGCPSSLVGLSTRIARS